MITPDEILAAIDQLPPMQSTAERDYLGASELGHPCSRYLWLKFNKYIKHEQFSPRMLRLFYRGTREEGFFEMYLRDTGFDIINDCFSQARWVDGFTSGAGDGIVSKNNLKFVTEYKTHSASSFAKLKRGELEATFPKHFVQSQTNAKKFDCVGTIYLAVNKDNDELFCDVILVDEKKCDEIMAKAEYITSSDKPPPRICNKVTAFGAKYCSAKDVCFGLELPRIHCRNCVNSEKIKKNGAFGCEITTDRAISPTGSCDKHVFNPYAMADMYDWKIVEFHPKQRAVEYEHLINGESPFGTPSLEIKLD